MQLTDLNWPAVQDLSKDTPVVFPIAALEQHGRHMPLFTDSMLLGEIIRRSTERLKDRVLFAPLMWLGNSDHHLDFPGTLSAPPRTYLDLLAGLLENFIQHGFRRLLFINGHGGNDIPGKQAVFEVRQHHRHRNDLLLLFATYWNLVKTPSDQSAIATATDGARLRVGNVHDAPARAAPGRRSETGSAGGLWQCLRAGHPRLDHERENRARPHRGPRGGHGGKRGNFIQSIQR